MKKNVAVLLKRSDVKAFASFISSQIFWFFRRFGWSPPDRQR